MTLATRVSGVCAATLAPPLASLGTLNDPRKIIDHPSGRRIKALLQLTKLEKRVRLSLRPPPSFFGPLQRALEAVPPTVHATKSVVRTVALAVERLWERLALGQYVPEAVEPCWKLYR